ATFQDGRRHRLRARGGSIDVAMAAHLVAHLRDVDLQRFQRQRRQDDAAAAQLVLEVVLRSLADDADGSGAAQSTSFLRWFCICTECTNVMPACMAAATCTASIICSGL